MLTAPQVLDEYFLETRCMLLEIAAVLDRYDRAPDRRGDSAGDGDARRGKIHTALALLADRAAGPNRSEALLRLFSGSAE
jgi:hypothetical protein